MSIKKEHKEAVKKDGTLKKKYKDEPRYKTILGYESDFISSFESTVKKMSKEVVRDIAILAGVAKNK